MKRNYRRFYGIAGSCALILSSAILMAQDQISEKNVAKSEKQPVAANDSNVQHEYGARRVGGRKLVTSNRARPDMVSAMRPTKMRDALTDEDLGDLESLRLDMVADGIEFLRNVQFPDGSFSETPRVGLGPTLVVANGLLRAGVRPDDPALAKTLKLLEDSIQTDGGIYAENGGLANYETCLSLVCFSLANKAFGDGRYDEVVRKAEQFVRKSQYNESNGFSRDNPYFGGVGYNEEHAKRPCLSNTEYFIEALLETGADANDPAIQDALVFASRCQNLKSQDEPDKYFKSSNDGGFIYTCISPDQNPGGQNVDGTLRSYGSMTSAGLKCLYAAGLTEDDPRVAAACRWLDAHYSTTQNPGVGRRGLYYFYDAFSKCLSVGKKYSLVDKDGVEHDWRAEFVKELALAQNIDGSWVNEDRMWYESDPILVTGYVLSVLSYCKETP